MATSQQPENVDYVVVSDVLYIDGHVLRKGDHLGSISVDPRLYQLLSLEMIERFEEKDGPGIPGGKTC